MALLYSARSENTIDNFAHIALPKQNHEIILQSQQSQDDSIVCYNSEVKSASLECSLDLEQPKTSRYGSCHLLLEKFLLGRAEAKTPNCSDLASQSDSFLRLVEILPPTQSFQDNGWKMSLDPFRIRKSTSYKNLPSKVRKYYKAQNALIRSFEETEKLFSDYSEDGHDSVYKMDKWPQRLAIISLFINVILFTAKSIAVHLSGSMAIISSLVDSGVDIVASLMIWWTSAAMVKRDPYVYPEGRTRLEPIAVIILSVLMSLASIQLVVEAIERIIHLSNGDTSPPTVEKSTITISAFVIVTKLLLYISCRNISSRSVSVKALQLDHRNDVLSNTLAIVCAYLGSRQAISSLDETGIMYIDPIGAVLMSAYIMANWWHVGIEQIKVLTGHTATPEFLSKLTWICLNHHRSLKQVDTVRAFHFGNNFLVEVDIVLPHDMSIRISHDIGESLQHKLERLVEVERAFVHLDYETTHNPHNEHKTV